MLLYVGLTTSTILIALLRLVVKTAKLTVILLAIAALGHLLAAWFQTNKVLIIIMIGSFVAVLGINKGKNANYKVTFYAVMFLFIPKMMKSSNFSIGSLRYGCSAG